MTDSDELEFAEGLAQMAKLKATAKRHEDAAAATRKQAADLAPAVARAGFRQGQKRVRAKVLEASPFSATTLRQILDAAGIPPDERFVRSPTTVTVVESAVSEDEDATFDIDALPRRTVQRAAELIEACEPANWVQGVIAGVSRDRAPYVLVKAAVADGRLSKSQLRH